jgi:hypothetical protein
MSRQHLLGMMFLIGAMSWLMLPCCTRVTFNDLVLSSSIHGHFFPIRFSFVSLLEILHHGLDTIEHIISTNMS